MNKTELKNFAIQSRRQLIDQVKTKALMYGIDEKNGLEIQEQFGQLMIKDKPYPMYMKPAFSSLKKQLEHKGYKQLVEEVAYTWFNRIIAIRYMEIHDYLPERVNVLSSSVGRVDPDILFEYETMDLPVKQEVIRELLNAGDTEGAYRKLFIAQCNTLNNILPFLFGQIQDYTELLLPDFLLDAESVIKVLVQNTELTNSFEEIEVIGWLYQYYIAEEKDRVFAQKGKYKKEEIPFATQLFTPKWIVQYMVQNSLGRYWTEAHQEDENLISNWEYFIEHEEEDLHEKIAPYVNKELRVEDIKLLDPAMGSGHILVYAFEVFHQIYEKCGYPERDIPRLIIENNLYGIDIDDRAYQLAAFAVVMKASSYSRRFLRSVEREGIQLNLAPIEETNHISDSVIAYIAQEDEGERYIQVKAFFDQYHNAKTYGSLINITVRDITFIEQRLEHIQNNPVEDLLYVEQHELAKKLLPTLIKQTRIMRNIYDVIITNPPYMGNGSMSKELSEFLKKFYPDSKADLFAAFMEINHFFNSNSLYAAINQHSWMFLSSYEKLRKSCINENTIDTMIHLGSKAFEEIGGEVVQSTTFVLRNYYVEGHMGKFIRAIEFKDNKASKVLKSLKEKDDYYFSFEQFKVKQIPGFPIVYWCSDKIREIFYKEKKLHEYGEPRVGLQTNSNEKFVRHWFEVDIDSISFDSQSLEHAHESRKKWFPYNKGGSYRKWYGNNDYIVNWENDGEEIKQMATDLYKNYTRTAKNIPYYFMEGITWSKISTGNLSVRYQKQGFIFDVAGCTIFNLNENMFYIQGLLNSNIVNVFLEATSPTLNFEVGIIKQLPVKITDDTVLKQQIDLLVKECIQDSKTEWNMHETSWDFKSNSLIDYRSPTFKEAFKLKKETVNHLIERLKSNEEKINKLFSEIYGLEDEVDNGVDVNKIPFRKVSLENEARALLSYFIGCQVGRYSLDREGIVNIGSTYQENNKVNKNSIVHFTESPYFEKDVITRLREFLSVAFASETVDDNLQSIAEALEIKKGEDSETRIRRYFMDEFFDDHCKMYQKRPIYWLVDSGKQKGLRTLIYMHSYQPDTIATIRFEHLQEIQSKYQNEINDLENRLVNPNLSASEKKKLTAEKNTFEKKMDELREFDRRLAEIANEEIEIDIDDGVKVNYEKFYRGGKGVLAKIK